MQNKTISLREHSRDEIHYMACRKFDAHPLYPKFRRFEVLVAEIAGKEELGKNKKLEIAWGLAFNAGRACFDGISHDTTRHFISEWGLFVDSMQGYFRRSFDIQLHIVGKYPDGANAYYIEPNSGDARVLAFSGQYFQNHDIILINRDLSAWNLHYAGKGGRIGPKWDIAGNIYAHENGHREFHGRFDGDGARSAIIFLIKDPNQRGTLLDRFNAMMEGHAHLHELLAHPNIFCTISNYLEGEDGKQGKTGKKEQAFSPYRYAIGKIMDTLFSGTDRSDPEALWHAIRNSDGKIIREARKLERSLAMPLFKEELKAIVGLFDPESSALLRAMAKDREIIGKTLRAHARIAESDLNEAWKQARRLAGMQALLEYHSKAHFE